MQTFLLQLKKYKKKLVQKAYYFDRVCNEEWLKVSGDVTPKSLSPNVKLTSVERPSTPYVCGKRNSSNKNGNKFLCGRLSSRSQINRSLNFVFQEMCWAWAMVFILVRYLVEFLVILNEVFLRWFSEFPPNLFQAMS